MWFAHYQQLPITDAKYRRRAAYIIGKREALNVAQKIAFTFMKGR